MGSYTYAARLSASSCCNQLNNGFELVKIWSTKLVRKLTAAMTPQVLFWRRPEPHP